MAPEQLQRVCRSPKQSNVHLGAASRMCNYMGTVTVCLSVCLSVSLSLSLSRVRADGLRTIWVTLWLPTEVSGSLSKKHMSPSS